MGAVAPPSAGEPVARLLTPIECHPDSIVTGRTVERIAPRGAGAARDAGQLSVVGMMNSKCNDGRPDAGRGLTHQVP